MKSDKYYRLELDDYAKPGFVSFGKYYFVTLDTLQEWLTALERDEKMAIPFEMLSTAFKAYQQGQKDVTHNVAYNHVPFLKSATVLHCEETRFDNYAWEHINIWGFPYNMRCKCVEARHLWLKCGNAYTRYVEARFTNLEYEGVAGEWYPLEDGFWGYPEVLTTEDCVTRNRLAEREKNFKNREEADEDWKAFCVTPTPDFKEFCNDIFGDG